MKITAIATKNNAPADFRSCNSFTIFEVDENGKRHNEKTEKVRSCAYIVDKVFHLIDAKVEILYVDEIFEEDTIVLENAEIEVRTGVDETLRGSRPS